MPLRTPDDNLSPDYAKKNPARAYLRGLCPVYPECDPEPPENLTAPAREKWDYYFPLLAAQKVISAADRDTLAAYCQCAADVDDLRNDVTKHGWIIEGERGPMPNPAASLLNRYRTSMLQHGQQLGFTPVTRAKAAKRPDDDEKPKGEFEDD